LYKVSVPERACRRQDDVGVCVVSAMMSTLTMKASTPVVEVAGMGVETGLPARDHASRPRPASISSASTQPAAREHPAGRALDCDDDRGAPPDARGATVLRCRQRVCEHRRRGGVHCR
jgi:hypothetical protein